MKETYRKRVVIGMKWHKFLTNFALWFGAIINSFYAFLYVTGNVYEYETSGISYAKIVYAQYGIGLHIVDIIYGVLLIGCSVYEIIVRFKLARYRKNAPSFLNGLYIYSGVTALFYQIIVSLITGANVGWTILLTIVINVVLVIINTNYYNKRQHLFGKVTEAYEYIPTQEDNENIGTEHIDACDEAINIDFLQENPFYIMQSSVGDVEEAKNAISDLNVRLEAELNWFWDVSRERLAKIVDSITNKKIINTNGLKGISRLNAIIYNLSCENLDVYELGYNLVEINEEYKGISSYELKKYINNLRTTVNITPVTENDIIVALNKKRRFIKLYIAKVLENISENEYEDLITIISEKWYLDESDIVLNDMLQFSEYKQACEEINSIINRNEGNLENEEYERDNQYYMVNVKDEIINIPPYCTCCMSPTKLTEEVVYTEKIYFGRRVSKRKLVLDMPLCEECISHRKNYKIIIRWIIAISIVIGGILLGVLVSNSVNGLLSFGAALVLAIAVYFGLSAIWRLKPLESKHSAREKSVKIFACTDNEKDERNVCFTLSNADYAILLHKMNESYIEPYRRVNRVKAKNVLTANAHLIRRMIALCGIFVGVSVAFAFLWGMIGNVRKYNEQRNESIAQKNAEYKIIFNKEAGKRGTNSVTAKYGETLPKANAPVKNGYLFVGYYTMPDGKGEMYYDANMYSEIVWRGKTDITLYAYWVKEIVNINIDNYENYLDINATAEIVGDTLRVKYSIRPTTLLSNSNNTLTDKITLTLKCEVYNSKEGTEIVDFETCEIELIKYYDYKKDGEFTFKIDKNLKNVYYSTMVIHCDGVIK